MEGVQICLVGPVSPLVSCLSHVCHWFRSCYECLYISLQHISHFVWFCQLVQFDCEVYFSVLSTVLLLFPMSLTVVSSFMFFLLLLDWLSVKKTGLKGLSVNPDNHHCKLRPFVSTSHLVFLLFSSSIFLFLWVHKCFSGLRSYCRTILLKLKTF